MMAIWCESMNGSQPQRRHQIGKSKAQVQKCKPIHNGQVIEQ